MTENNVTDDELDGVTEAVVVFHPEEWKRLYGENHAVRAGEPISYALPIEDVLTDGGDLPPDNTYVSDALARHEDAPEAVREWTGPFYVSVSKVR